MACALANLLEIFESGSLCNDCLPFKEKCFKNLILLLNLLKTLFHGFVVEKFFSGFLKELEMSTFFP